MPDRSAVLAQAARDAAAALEIAQELVRYVEELLRRLDALKLLDELDGLLGDQ